MESLFKSMADLKISKALSPHDFVPDEPPRLNLAGLRQFFTPPAVGSAELSIRGIGVREVMPPCLIQRPGGTEDWLIMLFHDRAAVSSGAAPLNPAETFMIWPPGAAQYYGNPAARYCHSWIHCKGTAIGPMLRRARLALLRPGRAGQPLNFDRYLMEIHTELLTHRRADRVIVENLLENALRELAGGFREPELGRRIPDSLLAVRRTIAVDPSRRISLVDMATMAGMSTPYFCTRFRKAFGLPPMEYLICHRMHHAAHLLGNLELTISEIGSMIGYGDPFHFSKSFKKQFGLSPRDYRRKLAVSSPPTGSS
jgi:AraC family transcriptional regulator of arabinose operon